MCTGLACYVTVSVGWAQLQRGTNVPEKRLSYQWVVISDIENFGLPCSNMYRCFNSLAVAHKTSQCLQKRHDAVGYKPTHQSLVICAIALLLL